LWERNRRTDCWQRNTVRGCTGIVDRRSDVSESGGVVTNTALLKYRVLWTDWHRYLLFFGAFMKLRKDVCLYVRVCLHMEQLGSHIWGFSRNLLIFEHFSKICRENSSFMKMEKKNNESFALRPTYIFDHISLSSSWNEKYFRQICRQTRSSLFIFSDFCLENRAAFENIWNIIVELDTPHAHAHARTRTHTYTHRPQMII
jgi:hypothetical protein